MSGHPRTTIGVEAALRLDVTPDPGSGETGWGATVESDSTVLRVRLDRLPPLVGRPEPGVLRAAADGLTGAGLRVDVDTPQGRLLSVGSGVRTPWWQRPFVRARHVRVHDLRSALRVLSRPRGTVGPPGTVGVLPLQAPPSTPWPLVPTIAKQRVTTTHDPAGGGLPRLYFPPEDTAGSRLRVFYLRPRVSIGDRPDADLRLAGVAPQQATIVRHADDEYRIEPDPLGLPVRVHGARIFEPALLRTGARIEIGPWRMVYFRAEYADHGRPYGGRQGGEIDQQRWQPPTRYRPEIEHPGAGR